MPQTVTARPVPVAQIVLGKRVENHRSSYDEDGLKELAGSIVENGLINPITVRPVGEGYETVAGHRRFLAVRDHVGWDEITAHVREMTDEEAHAIMLSENVGREDLDPIDEANAYRQSLDVYSWDEEKTAEMAGTSPSVVKRRLLLLDLIEPLQKQVRQGNLALNYAERMTQLNESGQREAARLLANNPNISSAAFSRYVGELLDAQEQQSMFDITDFWLQQSGEEWTSSGKGVDVPIVRDKSLPPVEIRPRTTTGDTMYEYMVALHRAGHEEGAAAVGNLLAELLRIRRVQLPVPPEQVVTS